MRKMTPVLVAAFVMGGFGADVASAQIGGTRRNEPEVRIEPPVPKRADKAPVLWNYLLAIIIVGTAFGANMLPSKRGHQD